MTNKRRTANKTSKALIGGLILAGATTLGVSALTAGNTVPDSRAGDGSGAVSGYVVTDVDYGLNATNPQNIDEVTFTLDAAPAAGSDIKVRLVSTSSNWYDCTTVGADATCATTTPTVAVADADELRVIAVD